VLKGLNTKQFALLRLSVWTAILTFMVFLLALGVVGLRVILNNRDIIYSGHWYSGPMHWLLPLWFIFTILFIIYVMARYTVRRLGRRRSMPVDLDEVQEEDEEGTKIESQDNIKSN